MSGTSSGGCNMIEVQPRRFHALLAGASGITGRAMINLLDPKHDWEMTAISRNSFEGLGRAIHLPADLSYALSGQCDTSRLRDVTHIFMAAHMRAATPAAEATLNLDLLHNLINAVEDAGAPLQRVVLVHGTKWYGNHLGPFRTPAREDDPRHMPPNFYYSQQDWISAYSEKKDWSWSSLRPHCVCGPAIGSPMNHLLALSLYAVISRELRLPLRFPGTVAAFSAAYQFTEAALLARSMLWVATNPSCKDQAFNMTNGEIDRWSNIWPEIGRIFGMEVAGPQQICLARFMADKESLWQAICLKRGLVHHPLSHLVDWSFADWAYSTGYDQISCIGKARRAGWTESVGATEMFRRLITQLIEMRLIPAA